MLCLFTCCENIISQHGPHAVDHKHTLSLSVQIFPRAIKRYIRCVVHFPNFILRPKFFCRKKFNRDMNFQRHPFNPLIMQKREIKARDIRVSYLKLGGVVTDTNCQRASQSLYETITVSLFVRLPLHAQIFEQT